MDIDEQIKIINTLLKNKPLNSLEEKVFRGCLADETYQTIALNLGYTHDYIRVLGASVFKRLSQQSGQKIKKSNICGIFKKDPIEITNNTQVLEIDDEIKITPKDIQFPDGVIPLKSKLYIERPWLELKCYQAILQKEPLIRLKAPQKTGKSSLLMRILDFAQNKGFTTISFSFRLAAEEIYKDSNSFLKWFCAMVSRSLNLPHQIQEIWDDIYGANCNSTFYFEQHILSHIDHPIILALDDVDLLFQYPNISKDFFALLRAWYEIIQLEDSEDSENKIWQKIYFIIVHSTEVYFPLSLNNSPFNVGLSIKLPSFTLEQVEELIRLYGSEYIENIDQNIIKEIVNLVGGNPYLIRIFLYHLYQQDETPQEILAKASTEEGIYRDYLGNYLNYLSQAPNLAKLFYQIVNGEKTVTLSFPEAFKLESLGLITIHNHQGIPTCELYRQYFNNNLSLIIEK
jgi:hypothetical protein